MTAIITFIQGIADAISAALDFLLGLVEDVLFIAQTCAAFVVKIPEYLSFLPSSVLALIVSIFAVVVIYKILGRE